jgi:hypothetical protein
MNISRWYKQEITYWAPIAGDDGYGTQALANPCVFLGRWHQKQQTILSGKGEEIVSRATIYFPDHIDIELDGWLYLGKVLQPVATQNPSNIFEAYIVRQVSEVPDLRNLKSLKFAVI